MGPKLVAANVLYFTHTAKIFRLFDILAELYEHTVDRFRVKECDQFIVSPSFWFRVQHPETLLGQSVYLCMNIIYRVRNVMNTFTALLYVLGYRTIRPCGFQQLDLAFPTLKKCGRYPLAFDLFALIGRDSQQGGIHVGGGGNVLYGNSQVLYFSHYAFKI